MVNNNIVVAFISALINKFENKSTNKKDNISGDFSSDSNSYPTVRGVKTWVESILSNKADTSDIPTKTSDLTNDSGFLTSHQSLDGKTVTLTKLVSPTNGYTATYELTQGGVSLGKIDIPKDYLLKSASAETVGATPTSEESSANLSTGDTYLKFVVNTQENDTPTALIIPASGLISNDVDSEIEAYLTAITNALLQ